MPGDIEWLERLNRLVLELNVRWRMFDELYSDTKNYEVFERTGPVFWSQLQYCLLDDLFLSISRFFDPATTGFQENFSLSAIIDFPEVAAIRANLQKRLDVMKSVWKRGIGIWRHKKLSHSDMPTAFGACDLPDISLVEAKELIEGITGFTREIEHGLRMREVSYSPAITGWIPQVLSYLELGVKKKDEILRERYGKRTPEGD
jgi:AbiU2